MSIHKFITGCAMFLLLLLALPGCYYDQTVIIEEEVTRDISFSQDLVPVLNESCNGPGCHNTGGTKPDLTADKAYNSLISGNYINTASPKDSELYKWITGQRNVPMPLSGPIPEFNAEVLAWIEQGAQNN